MTEQNQGQTGQPGDGIPGDDPAATPDIGPTTPDGQQAAQITTIPANQAPDSEPAPEPEAGSPSGSPVHHEGVQGEGAEANPVGHQGVSPETPPDEGGQG
jgi:hypothetical protein